MPQLNTILEFLAVKRAARVQIAAPLLAAIKEAQTLHDATVAEIDAEIANLESEAVKVAAENKAELFAKAKTYKHADSVLKLTTSRAVTFTEEHTEETVLAGLVSDSEDGDTAAEACLSRSVKLNKAHIKAHFDKAAEWFTSRGLIMPTAEAITIQAAA